MYLRLIALLALVSLCVGCADIRVSDLDGPMPTLGGQPTDLTPPQRDPTKVSFSTDRSGLSARDEIAVEAQLLALVNQKRVNAGLAPLRSSPELARAARAHSLAMVEKNFFEHQGSGEQPLLVRVAVAGMIKEQVVGENIFETSSEPLDQAARDCVDGWLTSPGHRKNMLSPEYQLTGIAFAINRDGDTYITEDFAR